MYIERLKSMFEDVTVQKKTDTIADHYHEEFVLYTNGQVTDYEQFVADHRGYHATPIEYQVAYDEETLTEAGERVAGRVFITTKLPGEEPTEIEVMLIARYKDGKLHRVWELTFPDWTQMPEFQD